MYTSKLATMVAILATASGLSALAGTAQAQIPGSTGGDVVAQHPVPAFDDPFFFPTALLAPAPRHRGTNTGAEPVRLFLIDAVPG
jgi:hypothetical protein